MRRPVLPLLAALLLAAAGCSGGDPEPSTDPSSSAGTSAPADGSSSATSTLPALEEAWSTDVGGDLRSIGVDARAALSGDLTVWTVGDTLVLAARGRVTAVSAATGDQRWTWPLPPDLGAICAAGDPAETGVVGLVAGRGEQCDTLLALDLERGQELWRSDLGTDVDIYLDDRAPYSAPDRLVAPTFCGATKVFSLRQGEPLPDLAAPVTESRCNVRTWVRDGIAVVSQHNGGDEPDVLAAIDLDHDRELWRTPTRITKLQGVRSTAPLVLDVIDRDQSVSRVFDDRGRPGRVVGLQTWGTSTSTSSLGVVDGHLVLTYDGSSPGLGGDHYYGFDLATGAMDWATRAGREIVLGRHGDALLVLGGDAEQFGSAAVLGQAPGSDASAATTLGTFPLPNVAQLGWSDELFLVSEGSTLTAYRFPASPGEAMPPLTGVLTPGEPGDVAPDADVGICQAIGTDTLVALGVPDDGLPAPAQCIWYVDDFGGLRVGASVWADSDQASDALDRVFEGMPGSFEPADAVPLSGVGDEALVASTHSSRSVVLRLVARHHNLVIGLEVRNQSFQHKTTDADVAAVQAAAIEAMTQMFEAAPLADEG